MLFLSFPGTQGLTLGFQGMHKTLEFLQPFRNWCCRRGLRVARLKKISRSPLAVKNGHLLPFIAGANDSHHFGRISGDRRPGMSI